LKVDGQLLGALTVSSVEPDAFTPELVQLLEEWSEAFAQLLAAGRWFGRRKLAASSDTATDSRRP
jgi:hypothetical protein